MIALVLATAVAAVPNNSWEAWINNLHSNMKNAKRPDGLRLESPLPQWVDCHLSWAFDHHQIHLPAGIVLRSSAKSCKGQLEEWAR